MKLDKRKFSDTSLNLMQYKLKNETNYDFTLDLSPNFSSNLDSRSSKSDVILKGDNLAFPVGGLES